MDNVPDRDNYMRIVDEMGDGVYALDERGRYTDVNDYLVALSGYDREDIIGAEPTKFHTESDIETFESAIRDLLDDDSEVKTVEATLETADGDSVPIEVNLATLTDEDGSFHGTVGVIRDITERKARERELERYETIVRTIPDAVVALDLDGDLTMINNLGRTGYTREELLGEHFSTATTEEDSEKAERIVKELILSDTEKATFEQDLVTKDGEHVPHETHIAPLPPDEDGMIPGTVAVLRDVSEKKSRERELQRQNERLEEFASVVSHDLRNPLNVVEGRIELARQECESEHLDGVVTAVARMEALIDDLLTLAREGNHVSTVETVSLSDAVAECWQNVETADGRLQIDTERTVRADRSRLKQLLENLLRNAIEHNRVDVTVTVGDLADGFYVADDGSGIPEEERDLVFERGYSTTDGGTGFGLNIVEQITAAHGWKIGVTESEAGGTQFEITGIEDVQ